MFKIFDLRMTEGALLYTKGKILVHSKELSYNISLIAKVCESV